MTTTYKKIELAANIAIVIVALTLATVVAKRYLWPSTTNNQSNQAQLRVGDKLFVNNVDWRTTNNTVVLVLQKGCRFCDESAPFYQRLAKGLQGRSDVRILAVLPQVEPEAREYLSKLGVSFENVVQAPPASFGVRGTPTLMLVNQAGLVEGIWTGKLSSEQEGRITEQLRLPREAAAL